MRHINAGPADSLTVDQLALLPEFTAYAHGLAGRRANPEYVSAKVLKTLGSMAQAGLLKRDTLLSAFVRHNVEDHSRLRLERLLGLERKLVDLLAVEAPDAEGWMPLSLLLINQRLCDEGLDCSVELVRTLLKSLAEDVQGLRVIVDDLLVLSRADAGSAPLRREPLRLDEAVRDVVASFEPMAADGGVVLEARDLEPSVVSCDEPWVRQLVSNLVENAIKFSRSARAPVVTVALREERGAAVLTVADRGPGIAPEDRPRIFERFYRGDAARTRGEGVGLGLAIAQWVAEAHGGSIAADNREGGGAVFQVRLPRGEVAPGAS